jgi:pyroglutamyl-peptidase
MLGADLFGEWLTMTRILVTAFGPYDRWSENASWISLVELTRNMIEQPELVTRRYPVDFTKIRGCLEADLADNYDFAVHLGQAPGSARLQLEAFAINAAQCPSDSADTRPPRTGPPRTEPLDADGPAAYQSMLPLDDWAELIRRRGIPTSVSHHAGTYLCNATLYWSRRITQLRGLATQSIFVHVPLVPTQVIAGGKDTASLPATLVADAVRLLLEAMHRLVTDA